MFDQDMYQGAMDACAKFGIKLADVATAPTAGAGAPGGVWDKIKSFGQGQLNAGKALAGNLRGGLGGSTAMPPGMDGPPASPQIHRQEAVGNLKTLAPTLLAGGAMYMLHRRKKQQEEAQQQAMMQQHAGAGGGYPM